MEKQLVIKALMTLFLYFLKILLFDLVVANELPVVLIDKNDKYEIGKHLSILEDPTGKLTIEDVNSAKWAIKFKNSKVEVPNYGYSKSAYWLKINIKNESIKKRWFLSFNTYYQNNINFFRKKKNGKWDKEITGDLIPFIDRKIAYRPFLFKVDKSKESTYFFRVKSIEGAGEFEISIVSFSHFTKSETDSNLYFGLYFGLVLSMIAYNMFIFLSTKSISYFYYIMYVLFFGLFFANWKGYIPAYLFKEDPWFSNEGYILSMSLCGLFLCLFTVTFLNFKKEKTIFTKIFKIFIWTLFICSLLALSKNTIYYSNYILNLITPFVMFLVVLYAVMKIKEGYSPGNYFLIGFFFFLISILIFSLLMMDFVPSTPITRNILVYGSSLEMILFSMALADKFNFIKNESLKKEKNLTYNLDLKKMQLEEEVKESTMMYKKLQISYDEIEKNEKEKLNLLKKVKEYSVDLEMAKTQSEEDLVQLKRMYEKVNMNKIYLEDEIKKRTNQLRESNKSLQKNQEEKSLFFAKLSHELRTPLNAVLGFSSILLEKVKKDEEEKMFLDSIYSSGKSLLNLVNSVHDYTKIDLDEIKVVNKKISLIKFLKEISIYYTNECMNKGINLILELDEKLPYWVEIDEQLVRQVLNNLLNNALKFTDNGYIKISAVFYYKNQTELTLEIEDTGIGMSTDKIDKLFQPFSQIHEEGTIAERGTGLGLYISKKIIEKLNGEIKVSSTVGKGTIFTLLLKKIKVIQDEKEIKTKMNLTFFGETILIADDLFINISLLKTYLSSYDINTITAKNGKELIDKVHEFNPDLIVTDFKMPVMNGENVLKKLREDGVKTPIILVSALVVDDTIKKNFQSFLQKPIEKETFINEVSKFLKHEVEIKEDITKEESFNNFIIPDKLGKKEQEILLDIKELVINWNETGDITLIEKSFLKIKNDIKDTGLSPLIPWFNNLENGLRDLQLDVINLLTQDALKKIGNYRLG